MQRTLLALLALSLSSAIGAGGNPRQVVTARAVLSTDAAHPASSAKAVVVAEIAEGFHINDQKPTLDYLIPAELEFAAGDGVNVANVVYPRGEAKKFAFSKSPLSVYEGALKVGVLLKIAPKARPGTRTLKGELKYQACNDHACLPPTSAPVTLAVKVVPRGTALKRINTELFDSVQFE